MPNVATYLDKDAGWQRSFDKEEVGFTINLILPNYEPRTEANKASFAKPAGQMIIMEVQNHSKTLTGKKLFDAHYRLKHSDVQDDVYGFKSFSNLPDMMHVFHGDVNNPTDFATCWKPKPNIYPSCERNVLIAPQMTMSYTFPLSELPHMNEIGQRLVSILNGYRTDGPEFSVSE